MNFNLAANSIGFYQISKLACIPVTLLLETILNRRQQILTFKMIFSLLSIIIGMGLVAVNEISFNFQGLIWAFCGVICSSCAQIFFSPLQKELNLDALQLLFHLSPILTIGSFATIPLFENVKELIDFKFEKKVILDIGFSCVMAVLLNTSNYLGKTLQLLRIKFGQYCYPCYFLFYHPEIFVYSASFKIFTPIYLIRLSLILVLLFLTNSAVLGWASPLTYQVLGHIKSIIILIFGVIFYDAIPSMKSIIGMSLAMAGVIIYTEENRQQQLSRQTQYVQLDSTDGKDEKDKSISTNSSIGDNSKRDNNSATKDGDINFNFTPGKDSKC